MMRSSVVDENEGVIFLHPPSTPPEQLPGPCFESQPSANTAPKLRVKWTLKAPAGQGNPRGQNRMCDNSSDSGNYP